MNEEECVNAQTVIVAVLALLTYTEDEVSAIDTLASVPTSVCPNSVRYINIYCSKH